MKTLCFAAVWETHSLTFDRFMLIVSCEMGRADLDTEADHGQGVQVCPVVTVVTVVRSVTCNMLHITPDLHIVG